MSPTVSANAQFWLHSAHIPCMQSFVLFLDFFVRAAATLGHCHFQFCCLFQQRKWKSSKEVVGLHTCTNSGPGTHHLLPFFFVFFFRRKVIFAASSTRTQTFVASIPWWSRSDQGLHNLSAGSIPPNTQTSNISGFHQKLIGMHSSVSFVSALCVLIWSWIKVCF